MSSSCCQRPALGPGRGLGSGPGVRRAERSAGIRLGVPERSDTSEAREDGRDTFSSCVDAGRGILVESPSATGRFVSRNKTDKVGPSVPGPALASSKVC